MNKYICKVCETKFSTNGTAVPPTPSWGDGHVCELVKMKSTDEKEAEAEERMKIIAQNGNDGLHYSEEDSDE